MLKNPLLCPHESPIKLGQAFFDGLPWPLLASPKLDGIRALTYSGTVYSRSLKPIPSLQVQSEFSRIPWLDGELIEGCSTDHNVYNRTQSFVMSDNKPGDVHYYVFDCVDPQFTARPFEERYGYLESLLKEIYTNTPNLHLVPQKLVGNLNELLEYELEMLDAGYEGLILKNPYSIYKHGRATYKQQICYKLKREDDDEAEVIGFVEGVTNLNEQKINELGFASRSSSKEGKIPIGILGKFLVKSDQYGEFSVAPGCLTHEQRKEIWDNRDSYIGKLVKFRHFPHGIKNKPRQPRFVGFRSKIDL